ncbi:MAG TPA: hypothetical protein VGU61_11440, partial [Noviherbaspirillum sp.]|uniref:hypothetical protein n=1 Tax=Noviherbaspirillum sp. TaxID=1926288 RepID=UPI002DDCD3B6
MSATSDEAIQSSNPSVSRQNTAAATRGSLTYFSNKLPPCDVAKHKNALARTVQRFYRQRCDRMGVSYPQERITICKAISGQAHRRRQYDLYSKA